MNRKGRSTLVQSAETLTPNEMLMAPELPTMIALDANLLAAVRLLEFQNPIPQTSPDNRKFPDGVEEHISDSICVLATALRKSLAAYYAVVQDAQGQGGNEEEVLF